MTCEMMFDATWEVRDSLIHPISDRLDLDRNF